jgi:hypothetical protein
VATERVPPVRLKDLRLLAAPLGGTLAGRYFPPGFAIAGRAHLFGFDAQLEGSIDLTQGVVLRGAMDPIRLMPGGFEMFAFTDASGKAGPTVDMQLTMARQGVDLRRAPAGARRAAGSSAAIARVSTTGFEFSVAQDTLMIDYGLKAAFNQGTASFSFAPGLGATIEVAGRTFGLAVRAEVSVQATRWSFTQTVKFRYTLLGRSESLEVRVPGVIRSLDDLLAAFHDSFKRLVLGKLIAELKNVTEAAVKWVRETVGLATRETIKFFKAVGARVEDVATSMLAHLKLSPARSSTCSRSGSTGDPGAARRVQGAGPGGAAVRRRLPGHDEGRRREGAEGGGLRGERGRGRVRDGGRLDPQRRRGRRRLGQGSVRLTGGRSKQIAAATRRSASSRAARHSHASTL